MDADALVLELHELLQDYIAVHNDFFSSRWRRVIPIPGLFQAMNFEHRAIHLKVLEETLEQLKETLDEYTQDRSVIG